MESNKKKKNCLIIGLIASVLLVLAGIVVMTGFFGDWGTKPSGSTITFGNRDFGLEFENQVANNSAVAAAGASTAAWNLYNICMMLRFSIGIFMICFGLGSFSVFGAIIAGQKKKAEKVPQAHLPATIPGANPFTE